MGLGRADRVERAREGDVVDVVSGAAGERPRLPPPGHATEHETRIAREADLGAEAETLHHKVLAIHEKTLGAEHPTTANSMSNLGRVLAELGAESNAEPGAAAGRGDK